MKQFLLLILFVGLISCLNQKTEVKKISPRINHLRHIIANTKSLNLPYKFDANNWVFSDSYVMDPSGLDSMFMSSLGHQVIFHFRDTSNFYIILSGVAGDMLYPCITTYNKEGLLIAREIIGTCNCLTNPIVDVKSCFDSVYINPDLTFYSYSELKATVQPYDSVNTVYDSSSSKRLAGNILDNGKITIENENENINN
jgi:hypothetical protein